MTTCIYCGGQTADGSKFCELCGAALPVEAPDIQANAGFSSQEPIEANFTTGENHQGQADWQAAPTQQQPYNQPIVQAQQPYDQTYQQPTDQQYQQAQAPYNQAQPTFAAPAQPAVTDNGSIGWGVLGFFFPIVGLVLFLVWRNTKPKTAKIAGIGAIIGFALNFIYMFFVYLG